MKTFKQYFEEAIFKTGKAKGNFDWSKDIADYQIFVNPTKKELGKMRHEEYRGFINMKGDLYLLKSIEPFIHGDILEILTAVMPINWQEFHKQSIKKTKGIAVVYYKGFIYFSESMLSKMKNNHDLDSTWRKEAPPIYKLSKKKNPSIFFKIDDNDPAIV